MPSALRLTAHRLLSALVLMGACTVPALPEMHVIRCGSEDAPPVCPQGFQCDVDGFCCSDRNNLCDIPDASTPRRTCASGFTHACIPECRADMPRCEDNEGCVAIPNGGEGCLPTCLTTPDCIPLNTAAVEFTCRTFGPNMFCAPDCRAGRPNFCGVARCNLLTGLCTP